ncbi:MAG TPA: GNAT family N-acetyltransferase [Pyrinomonadaceae bacterium]|nr:GNAT family N-acetyltransferase [Pyrinomonadaceae bacterium]
MSFVPAATVSLEAYAAAFTSAFQGYFHPVAHDAVTLARRVRFEHYDLANSLLALDGGQVAGIAALAVRGERGWCAGLGVVPELRGRGLGGRLMSALLERARAAGLRQLSLEVLTVNVAARRLYEKAGMRVTRDLLVLERRDRRVSEAAPRTSVEAPPRATAPREAPAAELLAHFARLHPEPPAWQRELASLLAADLRGLYVGGRRRPRAYALLGYGRDGITYVSDLAAADEHGARELCAALDTAPGPLKVINEPEQSPFAAPLLEHGFAEVARQHEMTIEL